MLKRDTTSSVGPVTGGTTSPASPHGPRRTEARALWKRYVLPIGIMTAIILTLLFAPRCSARLPAWRWYYYPLALFLLPIAAFVTVIISFSYFPEWYGVRVISVVRDGVETLYPDPLSPQPQPAAPEPEPAPQDSSNIGGVDVVPDAEAVPPSAREHQMGFVRVPLTGRRWQEPQIWFGPATAPDDPLYLAAKPYGAVIVDKW